jgi:hypothetical protein
MNLNLSGEVCSFLVMGDNGSKFFGLGSFVWLSRSNSFLSWIG